MPKKSSKDKALSKGFFSKKRKSYLQNFSQRVFPLKNFLTSLSFPSSCLGILLLNLHCEFTQSLLDRVAHWGEKDRREKREELKEVDLQKWERRLKISRERSIQLEEKISEMITEEQLQGELSRKIAAAYLKKGAYDMASLYYKGALQNRLASKKGPEMSSYLALERSLVHFEQALLFNSVKPELFYEAGLAYANASRAQGWEQSRFEKALFLFKRMAFLAPQDIRPLYQLALLYGKSSLKNYKNRKYAIRLLKKLLHKKESDIRARFALAHFLVEENRLRQAVKEYERIQNILQDMHREGAIQGDFNLDPNYRRAQENKEKLQKCLESKRPCSF